MGGLPQCVVIDFETATQDRESAYALGVVVFESGNPSRRERFLIRPPDNLYDAFNTSLHGLGHEDTVDSPTFDQV